MGARLDGDLHWMQIQMADEGMPMFTRTTSDILWSADIPGTVSPD